VELLTVMPVGASRKRRGLGSLMDKLAEGRYLLGAVSPAVQRLGGEE
jgi:hypothetical protein